MKGVSIFYCLILSICVFAQSNNGFYSTDIIYGNIFLKNNFNNQLNTFQNHQFLKPLQTIGISSFSQYKFNSVKNSDGYISYSQIIPQEINLSNGMHGKINGFIFGFSVFGKNVLPKAKVFKVFVSLGFNTGRIRISGDNFTSQKNPFFCPTISIQPRLKIKKIVFSIRAEYSFDVSSNLWRSLTITKSKGAISLPNYSQTGLNLYFLIGKTPK
jgi:hypothetical protein